MAKRAQDSDYDVPPGPRPTVSPYVKRRNTLVPLAVREANKAAPRKGRDGDVWNRTYFRAMDRLAKEAGLVLLALLFLTTPALAAPYLVCDPPPAGEVVTGYAISIDGGPFFDTPAPMKHDLQALAVGKHSAVAKAIRSDGTWGRLESAPSVPFDFERPAAPGAPTNINLSR